MKQINNICCTFTITDNYDYSLQKIMKYTFNSAIEYRIFTQENLNIIVKVYVPPKIKNKLKIYKVEVYES